MQRTVARSILIVVLVVALGVSLAVVFFLRVPTKETTPPVATEPRRDADRATCRRRD